MSLTIQTSLGAFMRQSAVSQPSEKKADAQSHAKPTEEIHKIARTDTSIIFGETDSATSSEDVAKEDPRVTAAAQEMGNARGRLVELVKELKRAQKIWANQPKELAKQVVRLAKELQKLLKTYMKAQKVYQELTGEAAKSLNAPQISVGGAVSVPSHSSQEKDAEDSVAVAKDAQADAQQAESDAEQAEATAQQAESAAEELSRSSDLSNAASAYKSVSFETERMDQTSKAIALREDYNFTRGVREVVIKLKEALEYTGKMLIVRGQRDDKDTKEIFKEGEKTFKELNEDLTDFQTEIMKAMPPAVNMIKVAA